ncbi:alpha-(1,3)-fucosyltransferase C-like [Palaemon carinicauda]|uniref:alpha-(1,3)-fucosyltransferase C-like n=1 Tax=Palaemon carinicauda TaxID=392227 RepID=UPI0035B6AB63
MRKSLKLYIILVVFGVIGTFHHIHKSGKIKPEKSLFISNDKGNRNYVGSFKFFPGVLSDEVTTEEPVKTSISPPIWNISSSSLLPLRGIGDSFLPFDELNATHFDTAPNNVTVESSVKNFSEAGENGKVPLKKIVFWNEVFGNKHFYFGFGRDPFIEAKCRVNTCFATGNRTLFPLEEIDALIWHARSDDKSLPPQRSPHTRYVLWILESPAHMYFNLKRIKNVFNWTFNYRRDSDFYHPFDIVYRRRIPKAMPLDKNYASGKTKLAAWFVSNCKTKSGRGVLVGTLQKWIKIDVYGKCGTLSCTKKHGYGQCYDLLERDYKFYFAFENTLCKDYATEKIFNVLRYNVIPVVYGLYNYSEQLPPHSYIDALAFPTAKSLADYLLYLDKNDTAYNEYFSWKAYHEFPSAWSLVAKPWCDLCARLHEDQPPKFYDFYEWYITGSNCKLEDAPEISKFIHGLPSEVTPKPAMPPISPTP